MRIAVYFCVQINKCRFFSHKNARFIRLQSRFNNKCVLCILLDLHRYRHLASDVAVSIQITVFGDIHTFLYEYCTFSLSNGWLRWLTLIRFVRPNYFTSQIFLIHLIITVSTLCYGQVVGNLFDLCQITMNLNRWSVLLIEYEYEHNLCIG